MSGIHSQSSGHQRAYAAILRSHRYMLALLLRFCCPWRSSHGSGISKMLESLLCFIMTFPLPLFGYPELLQVEEPELSSMLPLILGPLSQEATPLLMAFPGLLWGQAVVAFNGPLHAFKTNSTCDTLTFYHLQLPAQCTALPIAGP